MEISFIVVLWIIVTIIEVVTDQKRRAEFPPPQNTEFEIPPLANSPNQSAEIRNFDFVELYQQKKRAELKNSAENIQPEIKPVEEKRDFDLEITPTAAMNAIILSEILDKPKALRRRR